MLINLTLGLLLAMKSETVGANNSLSNGNLGSKSIRLSCFVTFTRFTARNEQNSDW